MTDQGPFLDCFKDILEVPAVAEPVIVAAVAAVADVKADAPVVNAAPIKKKTGGKKSLRSAVAEPVIVAAKEKQLKEANNQQKEMKKYVILGSGYKIEYVPIEDYEMTI